MSSAAAAISPCWHGPGRSSGSCVRWLPGREIVFVADSSFAALELLDKVATIAPCQCDHASASRCRPL